MVMNPGMNFHSNIRPPLNWNQVQSYRINQQAEKSRLIRNKRLNNKNEYLNVIKDCHVVIGGGWPRFQKSQF